tara:strand:- start:8622 stop:9866 length:1245 start_codon:yes stop_codon:yes gene_type:complete
MSEFFSKIFFPILLIKIVLAANKFEILSLDLGFIFFMLSIFAALIVLIQSPFATSGIILFFLSFIFYFLENFQDSIAISVLKIIFLDMLFFLAGAKIFITNPRLIPNQLYLFFLFCIPIMLLQISGASPFFMFWNTDYLHSPEILSPEELGTLKIIELYPTLFVNFEDLTLLIGQGRPSGLLHANNLLSYLVCIGLALNVVLKKENNFLSVQDNILVIISILTMSFTVFIIFFITIFYLIIESTGSRKKGLKLLLLFSFFSFLYYLFFPGIFINNFSETSLFSKIFSRFYEFAYGIGFYEFFTLTYNYASYIEYVFDPGEQSYSILSVILKYNLFLPLFILLISSGLLFIFYYKKNEEILSNLMSFKEISFLIFITLLIQLAIPFLQDTLAISLFGFALSPFIIKSFQKYNNEP